MTVHIDSLVVFDGGTEAPAAHRFCGNFYWPTRDAKSGRLKADWLPLVFRGATADQVRAAARKYLADEEIKQAAADKRRADREAAARVAREARRNQKEPA